MAAASKTKTLSLTFTKDRETKGTKRFAEDGVRAGDRPVVGSVYLLKPALAEIGDPETIKVTIEAA